MKYIIKESQFHSLKNTLNEMRLLHSKQFGKHQGPNIKIWYNGRLDSMVKRINNVLDKSSNILADEYRENENLLTLDQFLEKVVDNIIENDRKNFVGDDIENIRKFLSTIIYPVVKKTYDRKFIYLTMSPEDLEKLLKRTRD